MTRNQKIIAAAVAAVVVVAGVVVWATTGSGGSNKSDCGGHLLAGAAARAEDTVALNGTLARKEIRNITASNEGLVNKVNSTNGSSPTPETDVPDRRSPQPSPRTGCGLLPLTRTGGPGGRRAAAQADPGRRRRLSRPDEQLVHPADAIRPGPVAGPAPLSELDPGQPRVGHRRPQQGAGYKVGQPGQRRSHHRPSAGADHGRRPPRRRPGRPGRHGVGRPVRRASPSSRWTRGPPGPARPPSWSRPTRRPSDRPHGEPHIRRHRRSGNDIYATHLGGPPGRFHLDHGAGPDAGQQHRRSGADPGPLPGSRLGVLGRLSGSAQTTITNNNVPSLQITGGSTISAGGTATLTVTANQAPLQNTQVELELCGSAGAGTDYDPVNPVLTLPPGPRRRASPSTP